MVVGNIRNISFRTHHYCMDSLSPLDKSFYQSLLSNPITMRGIGKPLTQVAASKRFQQDILSLQKPLKRSLLWVIKSNDDQSKLGLIGIAQRKRFENNWELGVILKHGVINQGIAKEVIVGFMEKVLKNYQIDMLLGRIKPDNAISIALVTSLGFRHFASDDKYQYWLWGKNRLEMKVA